MNYTIFSPLNGPIFFHLTKIMVSVLLFLLFVAIVQCAPTVELFKRQGPAQTAPAGWKVSWNKPARLSNGASLNFISLSTVDQNANTITQSHVNACVQNCATTSNCGFVNLVKLTGSSKGNVVCMLYPRYVASSNAQYTTGPQNSGGTVDYSYGIRSECTPTNGGALTCTPAKVPSTTTSITSPTTTSSIKTTSSIPTTSTTSKASSTTTSSKTTSSTTTSSSTPSSTTSATPFYIPTDSSLPKAPSGATLIEWAPCKGSSLANPAMVNQGFIKGSSASSAYIVQHGAGSDFDAYFSSLYAVVGDTAPIISPGFLTSDGASSYYRKGTNLGYAPGIDSWTIGNDDATGASCSSYSQYDAILNYYSQNSAKFPNLQTIVIVGHSGGGNFVSRFSTINTNSPKNMRYIVANAANQAYFNNARPSTVDGSCSAAYSYPYQWTGSYNNYVSARVSNPTSLFNQWASRNVIHLTGDQDTDTSGTQTCQSTAQGGSARRDRNYAMWAYLNILAGTNTDVSQYSGYQQLLNSGATKIGNGSLSHKACTVAGVGHDANGIFQSSCGQAAILGNSLPAGAGASYPS